MTNTSVSQVVTTCIVLPVDTLEGNWVEKKAVFSIKYQFVDPFWERASKTLFPQVGNLLVFHAA